MISEGLGCESQLDADADSRQHNDTLFGSTDSDYVMDPDTCHPV